MNRSFFTCCLSSSLLTAHLLLYSLLAFFFTHCLSSSLLTAHLFLYSLLIFFFTHCLSSSLLTAHLLLYSLLAVPPPKLVVTSQCRLYTQWHDHQTRISPPEANLDSNWSWNSDACTRPQHEAYTGPTCHLTR